MLSLRTKEAIDMYVEYGVCGDFLKSVLSNDLMEAFGRADEENRESLFDICSYVYNDIPGNCHGSKKIVENWMRTKEEQHQNK